jgi:hypothetical protein
MGDSFVISGLRQKRAAMAGRIVDLRREADKLQSELVHVDAVVRLYEVEPEEIPTKGRMPIRSAYFGRNEISRRCRELLRDKGTIQAVDVAVEAMRDKGLDPENDKAVRRDFTRRILTTLNDLHRYGHVEKVGFGKGVSWRAKD